MFDYMGYIMYICNIMKPEVGMKYIFGTNLPRQLITYSGKVITITRVTTRTVWFTFDDGSDNLYFYTREFYEYVKPFGTWGNSKLKFHFA